MKKDTPYLIDWIWTYFFPLREKICGMRPGMAI